MTPRENDAFGDETSPFLGEAPLRFAVRPELDFSLDEEMTGRLDTPWLNEEFLTESFTAEDEVWNDSTEQLDFRERVLSAHIERSRKALGKRTPLRDLRDDELAAVAGTGIKMRSDAAGPAGRLIEAANVALKIAQAAGDASAMVTTRITANSGYRGRDYQRGLWLDYFRGYYDDTRKAREKLDAGPHSSQAVAYMINTFGLPDKIAAPGYSNHQAGIAIDLMQKRKGGHRVRNSSNPGWRETWRKTWFHQWLKEHAASFGFVPYRKEEWHWEYKPDAAAKLQAGESLDDRELGAQEAEGCDSDEVSVEQEPPPDHASSPHQQRSSQEPPGKTRYEDIDLKIGNVAVQVLIQKKPEKKYKTERVAVKPRTGIFIPDGYRAGAELDLVLYLHGHTTGYPGRNTSIAQYWSDPKRYFALREQVNESGRNVVLVAPTLGPHSEAGALDDARGLDSFVSQVLVGLSMDPAFHNRQPQIGNIILAGHSGAGKPMLRIALSGSPMASKIRECWLFDALYGGVSGWEKWVRTHPQGMFYNYHAGGSPTINSRRLEKTLGQAGITNALIFPSEEMSGVKMPDHFQVPMTFFGKRLRETSWLQDRSSTVPEQEELSEWEDEEGPEEELDLSDDEHTEPELRTFETQFTAEEEGGEESDVTDGHEATMDEEDFGDTDQEGSFDLLFDSETMFPSGESLPSVTGFPEGKGQDYWDPSKSGNPLLDTGPAHKDKHLSANLTVRELTTSGGKSADVARIDPKLVECIQRLRDHVGKPITITSGYRSWKRNKEVYVSRNQKPTHSRHCSGSAVDIHIQGMTGLDIGKAAIDAYGPNIGVGLAAGYAHIDVRGFSAAWNYGKAEDSWVAEIKRYQKAKGGSPAQSASGTTPQTGAATTPKELVRFAQCVMNAADGEQLREDGDLGPVTRAALERFRARYGLPSANVLDGRVQIALAQKAIEAITRTSRFATVGERDARTVEEIRSFQLENRVRVTGDLDAATRAAFVTALSRTKMFGPGASSSATPGTNFYEQTIRKHPLYDSPKRIADLDLLEPVTRERVRALIRGAAEQGIKLMVWETYRSKARQEELFKKGTTKLHAIGVHHYGLACDLVRNENGEPSWKGDFKFMAALARANKLVWGGDWGIAGKKPSFYDPYHVQRCRLSRQKSLFNGTWYPDEGYDPYTS